MSLTAAQQRKLQRAVHLATALVLVGYLYVPMGVQLSDAVRWIGVPLLVLTGVLMWQAPRLRRFMQRGSSPRPVAPS